jgi:peptidoglycan/LPS O-acetylase OafA/YrhL
MHLPGQPEPVIGQRASSVAGHPGGSKGAVALDQWRGLALILVLISHGFFFTGRVNGAGRVGVNLFFFISGILVYRSLSRGKGGNWEITRSFWWRRLRRLYPALIAYVLTMLLAVVFLQRLPGQLPSSNLASYVRALPWALGYVINYHPGPPMSLGHLWSLACEMQFYFLAPLIFLLGGNNPVRRMAVFGGLTVVLTGLGFIYPLYVKDYYAGKYHFEIAVWPMMLGFFCEHTKAWFSRIPPRAVKMLHRAGVIILAVSLVLMLFGADFKMLVIATGSAALVPCFLGYLAGLPFPGRAGRMLAWSGERTYSIYLWQEPFTLCDYLPHRWYPAGAAFSMLVGAVWFRIFEKPFLSVNRRHHLADYQATVK